MNSYYVYCIIDPIKCQPFYIGKGKGNRAFSHLKGKTSAKRVNDKIKSLRAKGVEPIVQLLHENLEEKNAYDIETNLIAQYGRKDFDEGGILMNICEDNRPPKRYEQSQETRLKISAAMKGKNKNKVPWNKGKPHKRGAQTNEQTILVMKTRLINLLEKIFEHYDHIDNSVIKECRNTKIIAANAPISEAAMIQYFGKIITCKADILQ